MMVANLFAGKRDQRGLVLLGEVLGERAADEDAQQDGVFGRAVLEFLEDQEQAVMRRPSLRGTMKPAPRMGWLISLRLNPSETVAVET